VAEPRQDAGEETKRLRVLGVQPTGVFERAACGAQPPDPGEEVS
jgi:hypothetical protein